MKNKITEDTTLSKILEYPGAGEILIKYKVPCLSCPFASMEMQHLKIGDVAKMYDMKIDGLLQALNELDKKDKKSK